MGLSDFASLYTGGKIVASGDASNLYDLATQSRVEGAYTVRTNPTSFLPYNHAPFETALFAPLANFRYVTAFGIWWVCNLFLVCLTLFLLRPFLPHVNARLYLAIIGLGLFMPLLVAECQGQDSILTLLLCTVCFVNLARGKPWIAGCAIALTTYKPQFALLMIAVLAVTSSRRWRILVGFIQTCAALAALSVALVGWHACAAYPVYMRMFTSGFDDARLHTDLMPNLRGLMYTVLGSHLSHHALVLLVVAASLMILLTAIWALLGNGETAQELHLRFALVVTVTTVIGYYGFIHDMTVLLLPLFLVWNSLVETGLDSWNRKLLAASVLLFFGRMFLPVSVGWFDACAVLVFFALLCWEVGVARRTGPRELATPRQDNCPLECA